MVGIGRIGKTTLVKKLYYQIQGEFQKSIFWENVKSMVVKHVEEQLLKHLCGMELEDIRIFHESFSTIKTTHYLESIIKNVVNACNGLPLSFEVMGSWLYDNDFLEVC